MVDKGSIVGLGGDERNLLRGHRRKGEFLLPFQRLRTYYPFDGEIEVKMLRGK